MLRLEQVVIDTFAQSALPAAQPLASWNFDAGAEDWQLITAPPFPPAAGAWQNGALHLQSSEFLSFGTWVTPTGAASAQPGLWQMSASVKTMYSPLAYCAP